MLWQCADAKFDGAQLIEVRDQFCRRDADEPGRQSTLGHKRLIGAFCNPSDGTSDLDVLSKVEVVGSSLPRAFRYSDVAVVRKARNNGIDRVCLQVLGQLRGVGSVQRMRDEMRGAVSSYDGFGRRRLDVAEMYFVTT